MHPGETQHRAHHCTTLHLERYYARPCATSLSRVVKDCQLNKPKLRKLGHLPPKTAEESSMGKGVYRPDRSVHRWAILKARKTTPLLRCLTMIDPVTGWFEIVERFMLKSADEVVVNILEHDMAQHVIHGQRKWSWIEGREFRAGSPEPTL